MSPNICNNYKQNILCSNIERGIFNTLRFSPEILDRFNWHYGSCLNIRHIVITKVLSNFSGKSIKIYYVIRGDRTDQMFFQVMKREIIMKLKKRIRRSRFPLISFVYDENYDKYMDKTIEALKSIRE